MNENDKISYEALDENGEAICCLSYLKAFENRPVVVAKLFERMIQEAKLKSKEIRKIKFVE